MNRLINNRLFYIDTLKGFTILCVILGHVLQYSYNNFDENHLFRYIYAFHMPLFMMISGFLSSFTPQPFFKHIIKKGQRLVLPFIMWGIITIIIQQELSISRIINLFIYPDDRGLWFLWTLFFISISYNLCLIISHKFNINKYLCFLSYYILLFLISKLFHGLGGSQLISWYFIFFIFGTILKTIKKLPSNKIIMTLLLAVFLILGFFFIFTTPPIYFQSHFLIALIAYFYKITTALSACLFFFLFCKSIKIYKSNIQLVLQFFGKETLGIYAIHYYVINVYVYLKIQPSISNLLIGFVLISSLSLLFVKILKLNKYLSFLLLGNSLNRI